MKTTIALLADKMQHWKIGLYFTITKKTHTLDLMRYTSFNYINVPLKSKRVL